MESNILLESGTNELELLVFEVGDSFFGINIAKVVEIMINTEVTPVPNSPAEVEGVFIPRDKLISVIDLHKVVNTPRKQDENNIFVICEFNKLTVAFRVGKVDGIQRISWSEISDPPMGTGDDDKAGISTGVVKIDGKLIIIMDFERIVARLNLASGFDDTGLDKVHMTAKIGNKRLVVADDSSFLNKMITDSLAKVGFSNVVSFTNGLDAWEYVESFKDKPGEITDHIACVISDIEMPKMDGHHLTKRIKDDKVLSRIPVLLFSSLINEQMILKCKAVGADGQFSKPQIKDLIDLSIKLISEED
ncbi:MAG: chemotaxis protein [Ruminococcus sp.]|jgi:two-component system chemotaxis response regulator CheV|nr:chemotaxis protein [Ruminococcus sp.]